MLGKKKKSAKASERKDATVADYAVLLGPVVTEKSAAQNAAANVVVFKVARTADKDQIKRAIERVFKVDVETVRTVNYIGKMKRVRRSQGRRDAFKKAFITVREGQRIDVVEGL